MDIFSKVRESTKRVTSQARLITLNEKKLIKLAGNLDNKKIKESYIYEGDFYFKGKDKELLNYVITLNAVNFGSGFSSQWKNKRKYISSFKSVANSLKEQIEKGEKLDARFAKEATTQKISAILNLNPNFKLIEMFTKSLNQFGTFVVKNYGSYENMISSFPPATRGNDLVTLLVKNIPSYRDISKYNGFQVFFLKRAQILVNDLFLAFKGKSYGNFRDINKLTMFADNLLPHFFRIEKVLSYKETLSDRIDKEATIIAGSEEEVEIRAFAVQVVEKLKELLNRQNPKITSAEIDYYIWEKAQSSKYKNYPRHKTETFFY